jgi:hypothetical protein
MGVENAVDALLAHAAELLGSGPTPKAPEPLSSSPTPAWPSWRGDASDRAHGVSRVLDTQRQRLYDAQSGVVRIVNGEQLTTAEARNRLAAVVSDWECDKSAMGSSRATPQGQAVLAQAGQIRLAEANAVIRDAATSFSHASQRVRATSVDFRQAPPAPPPPPEHSDPRIPKADTDSEEVKRWWDSLSLAEKSKLITDHPPGLGNLNGVPTDVRDQVNRAVMADDINRVENATEAISAADMTRYENAIQTRNGLNANATNPDGTRNPVFLQTYDPEAFGGRGRAAVAIGNPDNADNTAVLVPGTGSSVRDGYLSHTDGQNLYNEVRHADPSKTNSVLVWMGYEAPHSLLDRQVAQTGLAQAGGARLASDVNALGLTHEGASHVTVIGHSYGSTTLADAAAGFGMHANDVVLIGSPGTDLAKSAADFHLPPGGHLYVGAASSDPVTHLGVSQHHVPGTGVTTGLGTDPALRDYGSTRFKAEVSGVTWPWKDHSSYFVPGGESLFSISDIASGHGDALAHDHMTAPHRGRLPLVPGQPRTHTFDPEGPRPATGGHYH